MRRLFKTELNVNISAEILIIPALDLVYTTDNFVSVNLVFVYAVTLGIQTAADFALNVHEFAFSEITVTR